MPVRIQITWRRLALWLFFAGAPARLAADADLLATIEAFDHPSLGAAVEVSSLRLEGPHATWTLETGRVALVSAGERVVGLFFEGRGTFEYVSADPVEAPVVVFN